MAAQLAKESPMKPLFEKGGDANPIQPSTSTNGNSSFECKMILCVSNVFIFTETTIDCKKDDDDQHVSIDPCSDRFSNSSVAIVLTLLAILIVATFGLLLYARKLRTRLSRGYYHALQVILNICCLCNLGLTFFFSKKNLGSIG